MMLVPNRPDPRACRAVSYLLITLEVIVLYGTTHASSAQLQAFGSRQPQTLPAACQSLGKSNQRLGDLLMVVARHPTAEA
jgi:hypothetical protein